MTASALWCSFFASTLSLLCLVFLNLPADFSKLLWNLSRHKYWIGRSMCDFGVRSLNRCMISSLSLKISSILIYSPAIKTTSPTSVSISFLLCIILCFSWRDRKFSFFYLSKMPIYTSRNNVSIFLFLQYVHVTSLLESL